MTAMENSSSHPGTRAKSAIRALDMIVALAGEQRGLSFTELLRMLAVPKSSLHELLAVLTERGFVEYERESRTYLLGIRVWENGQAYLRHHELVSMARPVMEHIVAQVNETVQVAVLDGVENVYLAKVDCSHPLRLQSDVGRRLFSPPTGLGKVLLAALPEEARRARLQGCELPRFTPQTITDLPTLLSELASVRLRGFAVDDQEYTPGLLCVAVPIHDHSGRVAAAMSVSIPVIRAGHHQLARALAALAAGGLEIARRLGCAQDDPLLVALFQAPPEAGMLAPRAVRAIVPEVAALP